MGGIRGVVPSQNLAVPLDIDIKLFKGDVSVERNLLKFEKDVLSEFENSQSSSLWENVVSSLNEDARNLVVENKGMTSSQDIVAERQRRLLLPDDDDDDEKEKIIKIVTTEMNLNVEIEESTTGGRSNKNGNRITITVKKTLK